MPKLLVAIVIILVVVCASIVLHDAPTDTGTKSDARIVLPGEPPDPLPYRRDQISEGHSDEYLGAEACRECHAEIFESFSQTAHHQTSAIASNESIAGSFADDAVMPTSHPDLKVVLESVDGQLLQSAVKNDDGKPQRLHREKFDIVTGSAKMGQTYMYWKDDLLYQLPASYLTATNDWQNSPGFSADKVRFDRPITARCMECHTTYMHTIPAAMNSFSKDRTVFGISCEKCHGPGKQHVEFHQANPDEAAQHITNPIDLPVERQTDLCSLCHSGTGMPIRPSFSYRPGKVLSRYVRLDPPKNGFTGSIHSDNQLARLKLSQCFQVSEDMTCITCHDPHHNERGSRELFSSRCLECHQPEACGEFDRVGPTISQNCIDCHMARSTDPKMVLRTGEQTRLPKMADHYIRILAHEE